MPVKEGLFIIGIILLAIFISFEISTIICSSIYGDLYLFPQNLLAKNDLENELEFKKYLSKRNYTLIELNWFTAEKHNNIWQFYIKVQTDNSIDYENNIDCQANYWKYHANGDVYYNSESHEIKFYLIGEESHV